MKDIRILTKMLPVSHSLCPACPSCLITHRAGSRPWTAAKLTSVQLLSCTVFPFVVRRARLSPVHSSPSSPSELPLTSSVPSHRGQPSLLQSSLCRPQKAGECPWQHFPALEFAVTCGSLCLRLYSTALEEFRVRFATIMSRCLA